jgi:hypothetical protein
MVQASAPLEMLQNNHRKQVSPGLEAYREDQLVVLYVLNPYLAQAFI